MSQQAFGGRSTANPDVAVAKKVEEKPWEVSGTFETHRLIRQEDLGGAGPVKTFNVLFVTAAYNITDLDRVLISGGAYQYFLADSLESGFRASDISAAYRRLVLLPEQFKLSATGGLTIPISYDSQLASNITSPSLSVALSRRFGDLSLEARISGRYFWDKYTTAANLGATSSDPGGQPNPKWAAGASLSAEYNMPFHRPLSAGVALTDSYVWMYNVGQCPANSGLPGGPGGSCPGATTNPTTDGQPMQQSYGGEIFVRYVMPEVSGFKSDFTLALAQGDPSLGYPSVLHDGVVHPYLLYRDTAEVYFALEGRY
jgi:hypothetical protein